MQTEILIIIPGEPTAKGRPKYSARNGFAMAYTPARTVLTESTIALFASQAMAGRPPLSSAITIEITAYRAKGMPGKATARPGSKARAEYDAAQAGKLCPVTKPDVDNYAKAVCDALNGVVFLDDAQITDLIVRKRYSSSPRLSICVRENGQ
jgi:Holliday junction resolvase RusA-like endonuclease